MLPNEKRKLFFSLLYPSLFLVIIWLVKLVEWQFEIDLVSYGILPRTVSGLKGILFSPMIHGSFNHLINNSIPFFFLSWMLFYFYKSIAIRLLVLSYLLAGIYTWISARGAYHIGASGLVYSLFGFLFISGFIRKNIRLISISFLVAFFYGSLVWGILPWDQTMSWEGHFWGLLIGIVLAFYYRKEGPQAQKYSWQLEEDSDENDKEPLESGSDKSNSNHSGVDWLEVNYDFKPKE